MCNDYIVCKVGLLQVFTGCSLCTSSCEYILTVLWSRKSGARGKRVVDRTSKNRDLKIKEALHIQMTPDNNKFNRDIGLELPGRWLSMLHAYHPPGYNKQ